MEQEPNEQLASDEALNASSVESENEEERETSEVESENLMTHDRFVYRLWTRLGFARRFFQAFLPKEILEKVDLDELEQLPSRQIDKTGREHISDLFYKIKLKAGRNMVFVVLMEHKSTYERLVPFQMLRYETMALDYMTRNPEKFRDDDGLYPAPFSILLCQDEHPQLDQLLRRVDGVEYGVRLKYHEVNVQKTDLERLREDAALYTALKLAKMAKNAKDVDSDKLIDVFVNYVNTKLDDDDFARVYIHTCISYTFWFMREQNFDNRDFGLKLLQKTTKQGGNKMMRDALWELFDEVWENDTVRENRALRRQLDEMNTSFRQSQMEHEKELAERDAKIAERDAEIARLKMSLNIS